MQGNPAAEQIGRRGILHFVSKMPALMFLLIFQEAVELHGVRPGGFISNGYGSVIVRGMDEHPGSQSLPELFHPCSGSHGSVMQCNAPLV